MNNSSVPRNDRDGQSPTYTELPDWVEPKLAALYLRSGLTTIYDLCNQGKMPCRRFGRLVRIPKTALAPPVKELTGA